MCPFNQSLKVGPRSIRTVIPFIIVVCLVPSCSVINEGIKTLSASQEAKKDSVKKDHAEYAEDPEDAIDQELVVDKLQPVIKSKPMVTFSGQDPMAKVKINSAIRKKYRETAKLVKQKKYQQAVVLLHGLKTQYPQLSGPDYQLARIYYANGELEKALLAVNSSILKNQRNYYSINFKGVILRSQGKFDEAKKSYLAAIELFPPYPNSHLNLGVLADIYLGDLNLALLQYQSYLQLEKTPNKKVSNWVVEIERRIKAGG